MSIIATKWVYSLQNVDGIETAVLAFLASHNFGHDQSFFRIKTISAAIKFSYDAIKRAFSSLAQKKLIIKEPRYNENGAKISNLYILNIPSGYIQRNCEDYLSTTPRADSPDPQGQQPPPPGLTALTYNNNINNKINKGNAAQEIIKEGPKLASVDNQSTSWKAPTESQEVAQQKYADNYARYKKMKEEALTKRPKASHSSFFRHPSTALLTKFGDNNDARMHNSAPVSTLCESLQANWEVTAHNAGQIVPN